MRKQSQTITHHRLFGLLVPDPRQPLCICPIVQFRQPRPCKRSVTASRNLWFSSLRAPRNVSMTASSIKTWRDRTLSLPITPAMIRGPISQHELFGSLGNVRYRHLHYLLLPRYKGNSSIPTERQGMGTISVHRPGLLHSDSHRTAVNDSLLVFLGHTEPSYSIHHTASRSA